MWIKSSHISTGARVTGKEARFFFSGVLYRVSMYCRGTGKRKLLAVSKFQPCFFAWLLISTLGALALGVVVKQNCLAGIAFQQTIYTSVNRPVQWPLFLWLIIISCFKEQLLRTFLCPAKQVTLMLKNLEPELHRKDKFLGWHSFQASKDLHTTHSLQINYMITNLFHKAELAELKPTGPLVFLC